MTNPTLERFLSSVFCERDAIQIRAVAEGYVVAKREKGRWVFWGENVWEDPSDIGLPLSPDWTTGFDRTVYPDLASAREAALPLAHLQAERSAAEIRWKQMQNAKPDAGRSVEVVL